MTPRSCAKKGQQKVFYLQKNHVASCCRAYPVDLDRSKTVNDYLDLWNQESTQLDQGIKIVGCDHCWQAEDQGRISYRQQHNNVESESLIELYLSNLCNHMCSYCSPKFSSEWENSIVSQGMFERVSATARNNLQPVSNADTDHDYWINQIRMHIDSLPDDSVSLKLLGGEPLMQQRNLEKILRLNNKKIKTLSIHTNLNPPNNKFLLWILDHFPNSKLKIFVSLDATPDYNHVVRAGFDRDRFLSNFTLLKDRRIDYRIATVLSVLNIFDLPNFERFDDNISYFPIQNPDCLSAVTVPQQIRQTVLEKLTTADPVLVDVLTVTDRPNAVKLLEQYNYLTQYFDRAKITVSEIDNELFQIWWNWLTNKVNK